MSGDQMFDLHVEEPTGWTSNPASGGWPPTSVADAPHGTKNHKRA